MGVLKTGLVALVTLGAAGGAAAWVLSAPESFDADRIAQMTGDPERGALVFAAAGCAACHVAPGAAITDLPDLPGGQRFETEFGTFIAPNISSDFEHGIGGWTTGQIVQAVMNGVSPDGRHYYPAFPYAAYGKAELQDIVDLATYMRALPPAEEESLQNDISFPFSIRRAVGLWKWLYVSDDWAVTGDLSPQAERGRYLVEALGHCAECHTPRDGLGGLDRDRWLAGGPNPDGQGRIPNITPGGLNWSEFEIAAYLGSGFTPDFDTVGGSMAHVVQNLARLPEAELQAIAAYLKVVPAVE